MSRILTPEDAAFCTAQGLVRGFDIDTPDTHQSVHLCWPEHGRGALCASDRLWFTAPLSWSSGARPVDCDGCLTELDRMRVAKT